MEVMPDHVLFPTQVGINRVLFCFFFSPFLLFPTQVGINLYFTFSFFLVTISLMTTIYDTTIYDLDLRLWGKLGYDNDESARHPAIFHMLDVAYSAGALFDILPASTKRWLSSATGIPSHLLKSWIMFIAALHDIGKLTPVFQNSAGRRFGIVAELKRNGYFFHPQLGNKNTAPHAQLCILILRDLLPKSYEYETICRFLSGHHGRYPEMPNMRSFDIQIFGRPQDGDNDPFRREQRLAFKFFKSHFLGDNPLPFLTESTDMSEERFAAFAYIEGLLVTVSDWIGSTKERIVDSSEVPNKPPKFDQFFPPSHSLISNPEVYLQTVEGKAKAAVKHHGFRFDLPLQLKRFEEIFSFPPNPLQDKAIEILPRIKSPSLIIIEASPGSGKTETMFYLSTRLTTLFEHSGVIAMLPTQMTTNEMYKRAAKFLNSVGSPEDPINLGLAHGHSSTMGKHEDKVLADLLLPTDSKKRVHNRKVLELSNLMSMFKQFVICTFDQSMEAAIKMQHFTTRLAALANKVVVFDEIQAADPYMLYILSILFRWLAKLNCTVIVMTATLPTTTRELLVESFAGHLPEDNQPKGPSIAVYGKDGSFFREPVVDEKSTRKLFVKYHFDGDDLKSIAAELIRVTRQGGCATFTTITVSRAQQLYKHIKRYKRKHKVDINISLLHANFLSNSRKDKQDEIVEMFCKESSKRPERAICIATAVVEQSLDLDFDFYYTDLAPMDNLLQRFGRFWRHEETFRPVHIQTEDKKPAHAVHVYVSQKALHKGFNSPRVHPATLMQRTYFVLVEGNISEINVPADVNALVDRVYLKEWSKNIEEQRSAAKKAAINDPCMLNIFDTVIFYKKMPSISTRKIEFNANLICLFETPNGLAFDPEGSRPYMETDAVSRDMAIELMGNSVVLSHQQIGKEVESNVSFSAPDTWSEIPVLSKQRKAVFKKKKGKFWLDIPGVCNIYFFNDLGLVIKWPPRKKDKSACNTTFWKNRALMC